MAYAARWAGGRGHVYRRNCSVSWVLSLLLSALKSGSIQLAMAPGTDAVIDTVTLATDAAALLEDLS